VHTAPVTAFRTSMSARDDRGQHSARPNSASPIRFDRASLRVEQARAALRHLRMLLADRRLDAEPALRRDLSEELLREIEGLGLALQRPTVRQAVARVRRAAGLPVPDAEGDLHLESGGIPMPVEAALAFLAVAIDPPEAAADDQQRAG
jgi:hypothetical protein